MRRPYAYIVGSELRWTHVQPIYLDDRGPSDGHRHYDLDWESSRALEKLRDSWWHRGYRTLLEQRELTHGVEWDYTLVPKKSRRVLDNLRATWLQRNLLLQRTHGRKEVSHRAD